MSFLSNLDTPLAIFTLFLLLGATFVNGWTDAPASISSVVNTKILSLGKACLLCGIFNFSGAIIAFFAGGAVTKSIISITNGYLSIVSALLTVIIFGVTSYFLGLPSSESLALVAALCGASSFLHNKFDPKSCILPFVFSIVSALVSFIFSFLLTKARKNKKEPNDISQIFTCCLSSFIHGAQDGQKFTGICIALFGFAATSGDFLSKSLISVLVAFIIFLGTLLGGERIVKTFGNKTAQFNKSSAFCSDIGCFVSLFLCTALGIPVSTGNAKATAVIGAGLGDGQSINKKIATELIFLSVATLPICFSLGYLLCAFMSL